MERESFENAGIAELLNRSFVSIKVDREEMPDLDDAYMTAVQISTSRGGWPMSLFLTPDGRPFFAATYLPREMFASVITQIAEAWKTRRSEIEEIADALSKAVTEYRSAPPPASKEPVDWSCIEAWVERILSQFDTVHAGFGSRPKFPPHSAIRLLLFMAEKRNHDAAWDAASKTLDAMMKGGIHDHAGGGFHRYSVDEKWLVPHFEKMLYDNALMMTNYATASKLGSRADYALTASRIAQWMFREMIDDHGCFFSAIDADSQGEEGAFYTWTYNEAAEVLGSGADSVLKRYNFELNGNYLDEAQQRKNGRNILHLSPNDEFRRDDALDALLRARSLRPPPATDDKIITAWNGLAISGLVHAGFIAEAKRAADYLLSCGDPEHLLIQNRFALGKNLDIALFVQALLDLDDAVPKSGCRAHAINLYSSMKASFHDDVHGGWRFNPKSQSNMFGNPKPVLDSPIPSGNGVMILNALRLGDIQTASQDLRALRGWCESLPHATETLILAAAAFLNQGNSLQAEPDVQVLARTWFENDQMKAEIEVRSPDGWKFNRPLQAEAAAPFETRVQGSRIFVESSGQASGAAPVEIKISWQICTDSECLLPETASFQLQWEHPRLVHLKRENDG